MTGEVNGFINICYLALLQNGMITKKVNLESFLENSDQYKMLFEMKCCFIFRLFYLRAKVNEYLVCNRHEATSTRCKRLFFF